VGRLGLTSPLSSVLCAATTATSPSPGAALGARLPDPWPASVGSWGPRRARAQDGSPRSRQGLWAPGPPVRVYNKETGGSPTFPSPPAADMPRSQTPVVSSIRAIMHPGLLPAGACTPSAFPSIPLQDILLSPTLPIAGLQHAACLLAPPGSGRPLAGRHAGALLTGGRDFRQVGLALGAHPLGNINPFHGFSPNSKVAGLPWREQAVVRPALACVLLAIHGNASMVTAPPSTACIRTS
jgi:hypothetical protein